MSIPEKLTAIWKPLHNEAVGVHARWVNFKILFDMSPKRTEKLCSSIAWEFFQLLRETLIDDVQLSLARLGDPPVSKGGLKNATLETILKEVNALSIPDLARELKKDLNAFRAACKKIEQRRNKLLAHYDLTALSQQYAVASGTTAMPLDIPHATIQEIDAALAILASFMNRVEFHFTNNFTPYTKYGEGRSGGAESLIWLIRFGMRYSDLLNSHHIPHEDLVILRQVESGDGKQV